MEVEHVKAHRTKYEKEKYDESLRGSSPKAMRRLMSWQKAGAMLDEGFMVEARAETMKQQREEVSVVLQYAASFHCLGRAMERL